jgi:hypothetical protein
MVEAEIYSIIFNFTYSSSSRLSQDLMQSSGLNSSILVQHAKYIGGNMLTYSTYLKNTLSLPLNCVMGL